MKKNNLKSIKNRLDELSLSNTRGFCKEFNSSEFWIEAIKRGEKLKGNNKILRRTPKIEV